MTGYLLRWPVIYYRAERFTTESIIINKSIMETVFTLIGMVFFSILNGNYAAKHGVSKGGIIALSLLVSPLVGYIVASVNKKY